MIRGDPHADERQQAARRLCREGAVLFRDGERALALASYLEAWHLLPEPKDSPLAREARTAIRALVRGAAALEHAAELIVGDAARPGARVG